VRELNALFGGFSAELAHEGVEFRNSYFRRYPLAVASDLHDVGSILPFPKSRFVVVNPNWNGKVFLEELFGPGE
jgi:hypothetical protein